MIPQIPLTAQLEHPDKGEMPWSKWCVVDAVGEVVGRGMEKNVAGLVAMWGNEWARMRTALTVVSQMSKGEAKWRALEGLGMAWWERMPLDELEEVEAVPQKMVDRKGRAYSVTDNQRKVRA